MNVFSQRLYNQRLEGTKFKNAEDVVAWFGAVQAQEYTLTLWSLGMRMTQAVEADIEQAFNAGKILRTHALRPTWHFVTPADIRWLLSLTAPRIHQMNATMYRKLELDEALLQHSTEIIAKALQGNRYLTRAELSAALATAGIHAEKLRLAYILHYAELEGVICSGPRRGKQQTYALIAERAPQAKQLARDEALAELVRRYFTSHGPATIKDFSWWSGLTIADTKAGIEMLAQHMMSEAIDGETYWFTETSRISGEILSNGHLLPIYDEYTVTYKGDSFPLNPAYKARYDELVAKGFYTSAFVFNGEIIGMWRRTFKRGEVVLELVPYRPFSADESQAFTQQGQRFGAFLGLTVTFITHPVGTLAP